MCVHWVGASLIHLNNGRLLSCRQSVILSESANVDHEHLHDSIIIDNYRSQVCLFTNLYAIV